MRGHKGDMECACCGRELPIYSDAFRLEDIDDKVFCTEECAEIFIRDHLVDRAVEEFLENHLIDITIESSDPFERYGISVGDFL